jgi:hypothetical protein
MRGGVYERNFELFQVFVESGAFSHLEVVALGDMSVQSLE